MVICTEGSFKEYKGYSGIYKYSKEDNIYWGQLSNTDDLITYEGRNLTELYHHYQEAIDEYIELKKEIGKEWPFKTIVLTDSNC